MTQEAQLKACPFCGGDDCIVTDQGDTKTYATYSIHQPSKYVPSCTDCGAEIHVFDTIDEAIAAWNTRIESGVIAEMEAIVRSLANFDLREVASLRQMARDVVAKLEASK